MLLMNALISRTTTPVLARHSRVLTINGYYCCALSATSASASALKPHRCRRLYAQRGESDVYRAQQEAKENASVEANSYVSDIVEVDRTFELLSWIWSSITTSKQETAEAPADEMQQPGDAQASTIGWPATTEVAVFGGGCFWCVEALFQLVRGVVQVESGYAGGATPNPSYDQVCSGATGHAEVVRVTYDSTQVTYRQLLHMFFRAHDPTTKDRQGDDVGSQYRSIILYQDADQLTAAREVVEEIAGDFLQPIVTDVKELGQFYMADASHQSYYMNNPTKGYCQAVISPKVRKFKSDFQDDLYQFL